MLKAVVIEPADKLTPEQIYYEIFEPRVQLRLLCATHQLPIPSFPSCTHLPFRNPPMDSIVSPMNSDNCFGPLVF